jgi:hypothetical protein
MVETPSDEELPEHAGDSLYDTARDACRECGFSVFRGEERSRHAVFSRAVALALYRRRGRFGPANGSSAADTMKCSNVLTTQELKFLLE